MIVIASAILLLVSVALGAEYQCGGFAPGDYHSYMDDYNDFGAIRKVEVWSDAVVDAIRFTHGDAPEGEKYGGEGGTLQPIIELREGEFINGIDIEKQEYEGVEVICRLNFITNEGVYGPFGRCRHNGACGERDFITPMHYASITYNQYIQFMSFTF